MKIRVKLTLKPPLYIADEEISIERSVSRDEKIPQAQIGEKPPPPYMEAEYEGKPTEEELKTLRRIPGNLPIIAYLICIVEFCERASYYGVQPLISNFVNRPSKFKSLHIHRIVIPFAVLGTNRDLRP